MAVEEYPIDTNSLERDRPLSSDVARDIGANMIHVYRKRLKGVVCECPSDNGSHTDFYTTETAYGHDSVVLYTTHEVSPWCNNLRVYVNAIDNGNNDARVKVMWVYREGVKNTVIFTVGTNSPYDSKSNLSLSKLNANERFSSKTVTIKVHCIEEAEIYSIGIWETHE